MNYTNAIDIAYIIYINLDFNWIYYIGSVEGHEYPDLQVGDEVNLARFCALLNR